LCRGASAVLTYPLPLHDALPIYRCHSCGAMWFDAAELRRVLADSGAVDRLDVGGNPDAPQGYAVGTPRCPRDQTPLAEVPDNAQDRKSTRLNSSHVKTSYAVFCL